MNSYQKMKQRYEAKIQALNEDIQTLVEETDPEKTLIVKMRYRLLYDVERSIFKGTQGNKQ